MSLGMEGQLQSTNKRRVDFELNINNRESSEMKLAACLVVVSMCMAAQAQRGTTPRASAEQYAAHTELNGVGVGASLLKKSESRKLFSADLSHCCIVVEVALYPEKDGTVKVSLQDFVLRVKGMDDPIDPARLDVLAARLQQEKPEPVHEKPGIDVTQTAGVGYRRGQTDRRTGESTSGGMETSTGTAVGVGVGGGDSGPVAENRQRSSVEGELSQSQVPEGSAGAPVAGYLYFLIPPKMDKKAKLQLEYTPNRNTAVLELQ